MINQAKVAHYTSLVEESSGNRHQHVCIGNAISKPVILDYSVSQGSVLGPHWFTVYTSPVRDIILFLFHLLQLVTWR